MDDFLQEFIIQYGKYYEVEFIGFYGEAPWYMQDFLILYGESMDFMQEFQVLYGEGEFFMAEFDIEYELYGLYMADFDIQYDLLGLSFMGEFEIKYDLNDYDYFQQEFEIIYSLLGNSLINEKYSLSITIDEMSVDVFNLTINEGREDFVIHASLDVGDESLFNAVDLGNEVVITTPYKVYNLIVIDKTNTEQRAGIDGVSFNFQITCASESIKLIAPYHAPISKVWETGITVSSLMDELTDDFDISYDMYDWLIAGNVIVVDNEYPIDIIRKILMDRGLPLTSPGGVIHIEKEYPIGPELWDVVQPDHTVSTDAEIMAFNVAKDERPETNRVVITNRLYDEEGYRLDYKMAEDGSYDVKLYQVPFDGKPKTLETSGGDTVGIEAKGIKFELVEDEVIGIKDGIGSAQFPIYELESVDWQNEPLGMIKFDESGDVTTESGDGNSLLVLSYRTKYHQWVVTNTVLEQVQIYIEEEG